MTLVKDIYLYQDYLKLKLNGVTMSIVPNFVPRNYKTINILLTVNDGERALKFYNNAFAADITEKLVDDSGIIRYAEFKIEDTLVMLTEDKNFKGSSGVTFQIYTGDAEGLMEALKMAGATELSPVHKQFFGDRAGRVKDPFGYEWVIATHMEDVTSSEMHKRFHEMFKSTSQQ